MPTHFLTAELQQVARDILRNIDNPFSHNDIPNVIEAKRFPYIVKQQNGYSRDTTHYLELGQILQGYVPAIEKVEILEKATDIEICFAVDLEKIEKELNEFLDNGAKRDRLFYRDISGVLYFKKTIEVRPKQTNAEFGKIFNCIFDLSGQYAEDEYNYFLIPYEALKKELIKLKVFGKFKDDIKRFSMDKFKEKIRNFVKQFNRFCHNLNLPKGQFKFNGKNIIEIDEGNGIKFYNPPI